MEVKVEVAPDRSAKEMYYMYMSYTDEFFHVMCTVCAVIRESITHLVGRYSGECECAHVRIHHRDDIFTVFFFFGGLLVDWLIDLLPSLF